MGCADFPRCTKLRGLGVQITPCTGISRLPPGQSEDHWISAPTAPACHSPSPSLAPRSQASTPSQIHLPDPHNPTPHLAPCTPHPQAVPACTAYAVPHTPPLLCNSYPASAPSAHTFPEELLSCTVVAPPEPSHSEVEVAEAAMAGAACCLGGRAHMLTGNRVGH